MSGAAGGTAGEPAWTPIEDIPSPAEARREGFAQGVAAERARTGSVSRDEVCSYAYGGDYDDGWRVIEDILAYLSAEFYCAGWLGGTEYSVWQMMVDGTPWGSRVKPAYVVPELTALCFLSEFYGSWVRWSDQGGGVVAVPLSVWKENQAHVGSLDSPSVDAAWDMALGAADA